LGRPPVGRNVRFTSWRAAHSKPISLKPRRLGEPVAVVMRGGAPPGIVDFRGGDPGRTVDPWPPAKGPNPSASRWGQVVGLIAPTCQCGRQWHSPAPRRIRGGARFFPSPVAIPRSRRRRAMRRARANCTSNGPGQPGPERGGGLLGAIAHETAGWSSGPPRVVQVCAGQAALRSFS